MPWTHRTRNAPFPLSEEVTLADVPEPNVNAPNLVASFFRRPLQVLCRVDSRASYARLQQLQRASSVTKPEQAQGRVTPEAQSGSSPAPAAQPRAVAPRMAQRQAGVVPASHADGEDALAAQRVSELKQSASGSSAATPAAEQHCSAEPAVSPWPLSPLQPEPRQQSLPGSHVGAVPVPRMPGGGQAAQPKHGSAAGRAASAALPQEPSKEKVRKLVEAAAARNARGRPNDDEPSVPVPLAPLSAWRPAPPRLGAGTRVSAGSWHQPGGFADAAAPAPGSVEDIYARQMSVAACSQAPAAAPAAAADAMQATQCAASDARSQRGTHSRASSLEAPQPSTPCQRADLLSKQERVKFANSIKQHRRKAEHFQSILERDAEARANLAQRQGVPRQSEAEGSSGSSGSSAAATGRSPPVRHAEAAAVQSWLERVGARAQEQEQRAIEVRHRPSHSARAGIATAAAAVAAPAPPPAAAEAPSRQVCAECAQAQAAPRAAPGAAPSPLPAQESSGGAARVPSLAERLAQRRNAKPQGIAEPQHAASQPQERQQQGHQRWQHTRHTAHQAREHAHVQQEQQQPAVAQQTERPLQQLRQEKQSGDKEQQAAGAQQAQRPPQQLQQEKQLDDKEASQADADMFGPFVQACFKFCSAATWLRVSVLSPARGSMSDLQAYHNRLSLTLSEAHAAPLTWKLRLPARVRVCCVRCISVSAESPDLPTAVQHVDEQWRGWDRLRLAPAAEVAEANTTVWGLPTSVIKSLIFHGDDAILEAAGNMLPQPRARSSFK
jgi:hypothetical protein